MEKNRIYKIEVTDEAKFMLGRHIRFLSNVSKEAAHEKKKQILNAFHSLEVMPQRFPFFDDEILPSNKYRKMHIEKWYLVLYQIQDDTVYIDYILDCRQGYDWLLQK
ncbi:MAG: type II toxin-antitoxin system RelE/ParE family toxin [Faecalibacterium sp.]|nr:type II toxin-antitoxin system RelE/ParE family toxin [Ruminococcus sp.]MCM1392668.1 type II toxin-antitoxin system RelE/ParE family toxin [Ruminococcus sp.]MCM1486336.1 type II toxin-antitoxin system RelE/ParE family toxin [Faecalibacterium sp.]